jgi:Uma2 family endonuclease
MSITMQPTAPSSARNPDIPTVPIYRLTVAQYHAMADHGILTEDDPVELVEGWLVQKMTKHRPHSRCTLRTRRALESHTPPGWYVDAQEPITLPDSEPEPDVVVIRGAEDDYVDCQPSAGDVALVVEVADSTLAIDQGPKKRAYARAGIPVYWIANLPAGRFELYSDPTGPSDQPDYRQHQTYGPDDELPVVLDGLEVGRLSVRDLLP